MKIANMQWITNLFSYIDLNNQYTGVLLFSVVTSLFHEFYTSVFGLFFFIFKVIFISWIRVDSADPDGKDVYEWLTFYLSQKMINKRLFTTTKSIEIATSLNKIWYDTTSNNNFPQTRFILGPSWAILYDNGLYFINTVHGDTKSDAWGRNQTIHKNMTIYKLFPFLSFIRLIDSWDDFLKNIKIHYELNIIKYQRIYKNRDQYDTNWDGPILVDRLKLTDGLFVLTEPMKHLVKDIEYFLSDDARKNFKEKGLHYCKRICVYGPPGTGKSNLAVRIAGEYKLPIYYLNCQNVYDEHLSELFDNVQHGIIVIEEIDKCIDELVKYKNDKEETIKNNALLDKPTTSGNYPRLVAWHKVLDKIIGNQVIIYMTTNNIELLEKLNHGSIIRSDRVDNLMYFGFIDKNTISGMISKYYGVDIELPDCIDYDNIKTTPSDIINLIKNQSITPDNINQSLIELSKNKKYKCVDPNITTIIEFINGIIVKYHEFISNEFISTIAKLLSKNGVKTVQDAIKLFSDTVTINKLLENKDLPVMDEIKFKNIIKKEYSHDFEVIKISDKIKDHLLHLFGSHGVKPSVTFFDDIAILLSKTSIFEFDDFMLAIDNEDFQTNLTTDETLKMIDRIKLKKIFSITK